MRDIFRDSILRLQTSVLASSMVLALACSSASAQSTSADARRSAGEAFDRGTSSMLANDFRAAAHFFEQAYRLAPAAVALKQAIRAHDRAGNAFRAANLALRLRDQYPNDADGQTLATDVITRYGGQFVEVHASCDGCAVMMNEALVSDGVTGTVRFYVQPNATATITGSFPTGNVTAEASGEPGATVELPAFVAPPPPPEPEHVEPVAGSGTPAVEDDGGTPRALFYTSLALTVGSGAALIWSGINTNKGADEYNAAIASGDLTRARSLLNDGQDRELRTNVLIGTTAGFGALSVILAITTDWDGTPDQATSGRRIQGLAATVSPTDRGATVLLGGRF